MFHAIAPEVDINFYGSQAKENVGLDSDIGLLILVDKEKLSYDAEIFDALSHQSEELISAIEIINGRTNSERKNSQGTFLGRAE